MPRWIRAAAPSSVAVRPCTAEGKVAHPRRTYNLEMKRFEIGDVILLTRSTSSIFASCIWCTRASERARAACKGKGTACKECRVRRTTASESWPQGGAQDGSRSPRSSQKKKASQRSHAAVLLDRDRLLSVFGSERHDSRDGWATSNTIADASSHIAPPSSLATPSTKLSAQSQKARPFCLISLGYVRSAIGEWQLCHPFHRTRPRRI